MCARERTPWPASDPLSRRAPGLPTLSPTGLVCCTAAIQQEEELPCGGAQVPRLGAQVRAEAQPQHRVQQDVLVEASLQEPHLNTGAQSPWARPGLPPPGLAAGLSPGAFSYPIHREEASFCSHLNRGKSRGRWLSSAYIRRSHHSLRHIPGRLVWVLL